MTLPAPGILPTLAGYFGLLFAVYKLKNSVWALPAVFALTGFMGYTLGPMLSKSLSLPGGAQLVTLALATTGVTFLALSAWVLNTRRDFSFMGGFLFAGIVKVLRSTTARSAGACGWIAAISTNCSNAPQYRHQGAIPLQVQTAISRIRTSVARQDIARDTGIPG